MGCIVSGVAQSRTWLRDFHFHFSPLTCGSQDTHDLARCPVKMLQLLAVWLVSQPCPPLLVSLSLQERGFTPSSLPQSLRHASGCLV